MRTNHRPDLNGVLIIDKPLTWTSAQAVKYVRKVSNGAKIGHAGTLDPLATGVLVLCLGKATKSIDRLMGQPKRYTATVDFSAISPTDDLEAPTTAVDVATPPSREMVLSACASFVGEIMQAPPAHSAIWVEGERAYHLARAGRIDTLPPRPVVIYAIDVLEYEWPRVVLDVRCGKGTYIRSLARDLGRSLNTGGVLTGLIRTEVGLYTLSNAYQKDTLPRPMMPEHLLPIPAAAEG